MHQDLQTDSDFARLDFDVTKAPDRRKTDDEMLELIRQMFVELKQMRQDLHVHIKDETMVLNHAFPNGDSEGHRRAHDAWIVKAEKQAKFWDLLYTTLRISGIVGVIGFLLIAGWQAFLRGPKP